MSSPPEMSGSYTSSPEAPRMSPETSRVQLPPLPAQSDVSRVPPGIAQVVPPEVGASPCQVQLGETDEVPFWKPNWRESLRGLGWRWILMLPAFAIVAAIVAGLFWSWFWTPLFWGGWKLAIMLLAIPITLFSQGLRSAIQRRSEPFCIHCGYGLTGLPDNHRCPECGQTYSFAVVDEYRRDPQGFIYRYRSRRHAIPTYAPFNAGPVRRARSRDGT